MFTLLAVVSLLAILGEAVVSPNPHVVHALIKRQLTSSNIPAACQSQCSGASTIYNACSSSNITSCLSVCQSSYYNDLITCFSCFLENSQGIAQSEYTSLSQDVLALQQACAAAGETVSATASLIPYASLTGTGSAAQSVTVSGGTAGTTGSVTVTSGVSNAIGTGTAFGQSTSVAASGGLVTSAVLSGSVAASAITSSMSSSSVPSAASSQPAAALSIKHSAADLSAPGSSALSLIAALVVTVLGTALL